MEGHGFSARARPWDRSVRALSVHRRHSNQVFRACVYPASGRLIGTRAGQVNLIFFAISLDARTALSVYLAHHEARTLDPGEREVV